jgi:hypothetical protein
MLPGGRAACTAVRLRPTFGVVHGDADSRLRCAPLPRSFVRHGTGLRVTALQLLALRALGGRQPRRAYRVYRRLAAADVRRRTRPRRRASLVRAAAKILRPERHGTQDDSFAVTCTPCPGKAPVTAGAPRVPPPNRGRRSAWCAAMPTRVCGARRYQDPSSRPAPMCTAQRACTGLRMTRLR